MEDRENASRGVLHQHIPHLDIADGRRLAGTIEGVVKSKRARSIAMLAEAGIGGFGAVQGALPDDVECDKAGFEVVGNSWPDRLVLRSPRRW